MQSGLGCLNKHINSIAEIRCEKNPPEAEFADVKTDGTVLGSVAAYTCHLGYTSIGENTSITVCTEEGWQTPHLTCIQPGLCSTA